MDNTPLAVGAVFVILLILTYSPLPTLWKVAVVMLIFLAVVIGMAVTARPDRDIPHGE